MGTSKHRVFRPSKPSHLAFALPKPGFLAFGWAYRQAATALSKHFDSGENSAIVAPLVFLYRHALEIYLKGMLIEYGDDIGITKADVLKRGHRLVVHLQDLQTIAGEVGHDISADLEEYIKGMEEFDSSSQESRYPELKHASGPTSGATSTFEVPHFVERSEVAFDELHDIANHLSYREWQQILMDEGIDPYDQAEEMSEESANY